MNEQHVGSDFDDFLREDGLLEEAEAVAAERVLGIVEAEVTSSFVVVDPPRRLYE